MSDRIISISRDDDSRILRIHAWTGDSMRTGLAVILPLSVEQAEKLVRDLNYELGNLPRVAEPADLGIEDGL